MNNFKKTLIAAVLASALSGCGSAEESSAKFIESGKELMQEGEYNKARLEFRNALQINPLEAEGYYQLALIDEKNQQWKGMYANLTTVESLQPNHVPTMVKLGQIYVLSGEYDEALKKADKALELKPDDLEAVLLKATIYIKQKNYGQAEQQINRAFELDATSLNVLSARVMLYKEMGQLGQAIKAADDALQLHPDALPLKMIKLSIYNDQKNYQAMEKIYREMLQEQTDDNWVATSLAHVLNEGLNQPEEARKVLRNYIKQHPQDTETKIILVGMIASDNTDLALKTLDEMIVEQPENQELRFAKIEMLHSLNRTSEMLEDLQAIAEADPSGESGLRAKATLATIEASKENFDTAEQMVDEVLALSSENETALLLKSKLLLREDHLDPAINNLRTIIRNNPESDEAMVLLAQAYMRSGSADLADNSFRQALSVNPGNPQAAMSVASSLMRSNDLDRTESILKNAVAGNPNNEELLQALAQVQIMKKDWASTQQTLQELSTDDSDNAITYLLTAQMYQGLEDYTVAIAEYKKALEINPQLTRALQELVNSYVAADQKEQVTPYLNQHIEDHPDLINGYSVLADYYRNEGNSDKAIEITELALDKNPQWTGGYSFMAAVYQDNNEPEKAVEAYQRGLENLPTDLVLMMQLASTFERLGQYENARDLYETVLAQNPEIEPAVNNLAMLLSDQFESPENLQRALTLSTRFSESSQPYFVDTYGWVQYKLGNYEDARKAIELAVENGNDIPVFHYHLGLVYKALEMNEQAENHLILAERLAQEQDDQALLNQINEHLSQN